MTGETDEMPSKKLWAYIAKLEKVIKETMESSDEIAELVAKIQDEGIEVSLNCIALFSDPKGKTFTGPSGGHPLNAASAAAAAAAAKAITEGKKRGRKRPASPSDEGAKEAAPDGAPPARRTKRPGRGARSKGEAGSGLQVTEADREFLKEIGIRID
jgi:hypothetical protein